MKKARSYAYAWLAPITVALLLAALLLTALISLNLETAFTEDDIPIVEETPITFTPAKEYEEEYRQIVDALYRAYYNLPREWADVLAKYEEQTEPFEPKTAIKTAPKMLEKIELGIDLGNSEPALYWYTTSNRLGDLELLGGVFTRYEGEEAIRSLAWPIVDPNRECEGFAKVVPSMKSGEVWEFYTYHYPFGVIRYVVLATPDIYNIKSLRLRLYEIPDNTATTATTE